MKNGVLRLEHASGEGRQGDRGESRGERINQNQTYMTSCRTGAGEMCTTGRINRNQCPQDHTAGFKHDFFILPKREELALRLWLIAGPVLA